MNELVVALAVIAAFLLGNALQFSIVYRRRARSIGWTDLARAHRFDGSVQGILFAEGGLVGRFGQRGSSTLPLTMILASRGVGLRMENTFFSEISGLTERFFPPLFLPWHEILSIERRSKLFGEVYRVRFASTPKEWHFDAHFGAAFMSAWKFAHGLSDEPPRGIPVPW